MRHLRTSLSALILALGLLGGLGAAGVLVAPPPAAACSTDDC